MKVEYYNAKYRTEEIVMCKQSREKIRGIDEEGIRGLKALIERHKQKAQRAANCKDTLSETKNKEIVANLEKRLLARDNVSKKPLM